MSFNAVPSLRTALLLTLSFGLSQAFAADTKSQVQAALPVVRQMAQAPEVVAAVKAQNARHQTMAAIHALDAKWIASAGIPDFIQPWPKLGHIWRSGIGTASAARETLGVWWCLVCLLLVGSCWRNRNRCRKRNSH